MFTIEVSKRRGLTGLGTMLVFVVGLVLAVGRSGFRRAVGVRR